jgi:hypothetical protein
MRPVKTERSNTVYKGDGSSVADVWTEVGELKEDGTSTDGARVVYLVWEPTPEERQQIAADANIKVGMLHMQHIPPSFVEVTTEEVVDG